MTRKAHQEIHHGQKLAAANPTGIWGWGSPAGKKRASRRAELIISGADLRPGQKCLEIGCGTGLFTEFFIATGIDLLAVDISLDLIKLARTRNLCSDRVKFVAESFEELQTVDQYNAVIGSSILHHIDLPGALTKMYSLLKPGGRICFAEPNMLNPQIALQKNIPWLKKRLGDTPEETAFFRWQLAGLLRKAGFTEVLITPFDWLHPLTPESFVGGVGKIGTVLERLPVIKEFAGSLLIRGRKKRNSLERPGSGHAN